MRNTLFALLAAIALVPSGARAEPDRAYTIDFVLTEEGCEPFSPSVRMSVGGMAQLTVDGGFRIDATLTSTNDGRLLLETELSREDGQHRVVESRPSIMLTRDGEASIQTTSETWDKVQVSIRPAT